MGLAAFNRMRRVEAMKAENIKKEELAKENAMDLDKTNEEAKEDYVEVETNEELSVKDEPVKRSRRN